MADELDDLTQKLLAQIARRNQAWGRGARNAPKPSPAAPPEVKIAAAQQQVIQVTQEIGADLPVFTTGFILTDFVRGTAQAVGAQADLIREMNRVFSSTGFRSKAAGMLADGHREVGEAAQRSLHAAYTHRRHRRGSPDYRQNDEGRYRRYSGGALGRALRAEGHVAADADGLSFLDQTILNSQAKQWGRLNFGAGAAAGEAPGKFPIGFEGMIVGTLGLPAAPGDPFFLPPGYWFNASGERVGGVGGGGRSGDAFYPVWSPEFSNMKPGRVGRPSPLRLTRGIAASNFIDAGVRRIANEILPMYFGVFNSYADSAGRSVRVRPRSMTTVVTTRETRPNRSRLGRLVTDA